MHAITNGRVLTMAGKDYDKGTILIKEGKILAIGADIPIPAGTDITDVAGKVVMPGFIDAHSHVGIMEEIFHEGDDGNEISEPVTPHLRAIDGINPEDLGFKDALLGGVTTVVATPGSANVIGGEMVAIKTHGAIVDEMVIKAPAGLKVAFGENPKRVYGTQKKAPVTRMATAGLLREALVKAQNYANKLDKGRQDSSQLPERDLRLETLVKVLKREIPLRAHAHRADDIVTAIRIAEEFNLDLIIEHCTEGYKIASFLADKKIPAVVGPTMTNRAKVELKDRSVMTPGLLSNAGVKVAIMTDHPVIPINYLSLMAALAVKEGMSPQAALEAITIEAARICRIDSRVGSLEVGKDADIIILDGHPLDLQTRVEKVFINGLPVNQEL
ncbi:MAG: amidohydrolase [Clostridia bacterium]|nr:amidohydrolase [Clostridia bacterium]